MLRVQCRFLHALSGALIPAEAGIRDRKRADIGCLLSNNKGRNGGSQSKQGYSERFEVTGPSDKTGLDSDEVFSIRNYDTLRLFFVNVVNPSGVPPLKKAFLTSPT